MKQSDDAKLYSLIQPAVGKMNAGALVAASIDTARKREQVFQKFCNSRDEISTEIDLNHL
jgi:hypothetical protein